MGLFSAIAGIFSGGAQKRASQKATDAEVAAINRGIDFQQQQYQTTRNDYAPYTTAGVKAIDSYGNLLGANGGDAEAAAVSNLKSSPFFGQELADANENLLQTASATGGVRGGNTAGAVGQLAPDLLEKHYNDALTGYGNLANLGLGATGSLSNFGANNARSVSGLYGDIGTAQARNYITKGGIDAANFSNFGNVLDTAASAALGGLGGAAGGAGNLGGFGPGSLFARNFGALPAGSVFGGGTVGIGGPTGSAPGSGGGGINFTNALKSIF